MSEAPVMSDVAEVDVIVVGGGISGLSAALAAQRSGASVVLLEASGRVGGMIQTGKQDGFIYELGPTSMMGNPEIAALIDELDLVEHVQRPNASARRRYIQRNGRLQAVPMSPLSFVSSPLLTFGGKVRLLGEPFISRRGAAATEESLGAFVRRRFGADVRDYIVDPFVSGVYAGDIERLSANHALPMLRQLEQGHGSVLLGGVSKGWKSRGQPRKLGMLSFRDGLETLPRAMAARLGSTVQLRSHVTSIAHVDRGLLVDYVRTDVAGKSLSQRIAGRRVVLATPAHSLSGIRFDNATSIAIEPASQINHAPVTTISLGFRREQVKHPLDGFGALAPSREQSAVLGTLFPSSIFSNRAPGGHVLVTCFMGGSRAKSGRRQDSASVVAQAMDCLRPLLGVTGAPVLERTNFLPWAIPQYELGYASMLDTLRHAEESAPGLGLVGSYRGGVSVGDCVSNGLASGLRAAQAH